jgi:hypothetical protein
MKMHKVMQGETVVGLAELYDMLPDTIWKANPALAKLRSSMNVLLPGDEVIIPDENEKVESVPTTKHHKFVIKPLSALFRLQLFRNEEPFAKKKYKLLVDRVEVSKPDAQTNADGVVEALVPARAQTGVLTFPTEEYSFEVGFGYLDPHDADSGWRQRLRQLGYRPGRERDRSLSADTKVALASFQNRFREKYGLEVTGTPDEATLKALEDFFSAVNRFPPRPKPLPPPPPRAPAIAPATPVEVCAVYATMIHCSHENEESKKKREPCPDPHRRSAGGRSEHHVLMVAPELQPAALVSLFGGKAAGGSTTFKPGEDGDDRWEYKPTAGDAITCEAKRAGKCKHGAHTEWRYVPPKGAPEKKNGEEKVQFSSGAWIQNPKLASLKLDTEKSWQALFRAKAIGEQDVDLGGVLKDDPAAKNKLAQASKEIHEKHEENVGEDKMAGKAQTWLSGHVNGLSWTGGAQPAVCDLDASGCTTEGNHRYQLWVYPSDRFDIGITIDLPNALKDAFGDDRGVQSFLKVWDAFQSRNVRSVGGVSFSTVSKIEAKFHLTVRGDVEGVAGPSLLLRPRRLGEARALGQSFDRDRSRPDHRERHQPGRRRGRQGRQLARQARLADRQRDHRRRGLGHRGLQVRHQGRGASPRQRRRARQTQRPRHLQRSAADRQEGAGRDLRGLVRRQPQVRAQCLRVHRHQVARVGHGERIVGLEVQGPAKTG